MSHMWTDEDVSQLGHAAGAYRYVVPFSTERTSRTSLVSTSTKRESPKALALRLGYAQCA